MVETLTTEFFRDYNPQLMHQFTEKMHNMELEEYCSKSGFGDLFTTHLCIGKQDILNYFVKESQSRIDIDEQNEALKLRLSGITLEFGFAFRLWSDPEWLHDQGTGVIEVSGCDLSLNLNLESVEGELEVSYSDVKIHSRDYSVELKGETDISAAV